MTVIAWDGTILATDRQINVGEMRYEGHKSRILEDGKTVLAWNGCVDAGLIMLEWYIAGASPDKWPYSEIGNVQDKAMSDLVVVINRSDYPDCFYYTQIPYPHRFVSKFKTWGSGDEIALGALAAGRNSIDAVRIACAHGNSCGFGVDWYDFSKPYRVICGIADLSWP